MANVVGRIPVGADTRPLERDIQASLNKNYQLKGLNEKAFTQPLGRITGSVDEFRKSLDASNARVLAFGASAGAIFAVERSFQALITTTLKVQKNLTDINSILGLSSKSLQAFGDQLFKVAAQTGQSFDTVSQAAVEFSRQGLGVEETLKRTRDALILTRLSGLDVVASTEALTATINSFNKVALDSTVIVNKLATVDAAFAVSSADLAEAIQRVGSSAESVGLNLDQLVALVTSVQQTTARGGSVIGNSLKTIFTRLERTEVLDQLEQLGIQVRNLDGSFRPAIETLSQLAQRFDGLSDAQRANVAELVGGVFQINILKAALGDLGKQYSIYNSALNTSTNATDAAVKRNEQLNQTLSALVNRTVANITKLGAEIGGLTLAPAIESILSNVNSALESFSLTDAKGPGEKIAKGFLEGIGSYISGPGLALIGAVVGKLFINLAKFSTQAVGQILEINKGAQQQAELQQRINSILAQNPNLIQGILNKEISLLQVEQDILNVIRAQTVAREQSAKISATIAGNLATRGVTTTGGKISARSGGFIPNFASPETAEIYGAYLGGYKPGKVAKTNIPGEGSVIYNQAEKIKKFPGMVQPAIIPPQSSSAGERYRKAFQDKLGFNPYASAGYIPNFQNINELIRANQGNLVRVGNTQTFKVGSTGITASQSTIDRALQSGGRSTSTLDARGIATMLVPPQGFSGSTGEAVVGGTRVIYPVKTYNPKYRNAGQIRDIQSDVSSAIANATLSYATSIRPPAIIPSQQELINGLNTTAGAKGAINAAAGAAFEVGLNLALGSRAAAVEGLNFDVIGLNPELGRLFGYKTPLADFKINDNSKSNRQSMAEKIITASGVLGKKAFTTTAGLNAEGIAREKAGRQAIVSRYLKSSGFIPNYSALIDSMRREVTAGVSPNSIRVGQDPRLRNAENPLGLGVYNTKDEPKGLAEGISRYNNLRSARKAGSFKGYVPNYISRDRLASIALASSFGLPIAAGVAEQFIPETDTRTRAGVRGAANIASFAGTGFAIGGPAGGVIGGLIGVISTLNDLDKAANQEGIDKFTKLVEQSQENLNKMNDSFTQFNVITEKLSNSANLSAKDIEQLQQKLISNLSVLPEDLRKQLIDAYGEGDILKIQSIQTNALEVTQAKQAIAQYQAGIAEANAPATFGEFVSESFGFSGATQRREKILKEKLNLSNTNLAVTEFEGKTKTIASLISEEFNSFFEAEKRAGESFQEYSDRYQKLVDEALKNPKILQYVSQQAGKKIIAEAEKTGDPDKIRAAQQQATDLYKKYLELGPEAIKGFADAQKTLGKREVRTANVEQFKNVLSKYLTDITKSTTDLTISYSRAETEIDINLRKLQSAKNNLLENAKLFAGEFTQISIESEFEQANANLEYQRNVLQINRRVRERVGPSLFAETLSGLRGTNEPSSRAFADYLNNELQNVQSLNLEELPQRLTEIISEIDQQFARNSQLNDKTRDAAKSFINKLNETLIKDLPEAQADLQRLDQLLKAENELRAKEIEARFQNVRQRQAIAFAGGAESLRRDDFNQRVSEFTRNRFLLGSQNQIERGRGALGLFDELRQFGIGPQSISPKLQGQIVGGLTANIQRFSQAYGLNIGPQQARDIAQKQFDSIAKQEKNVEEILNQLNSISTSGIPLSASTIAALGGINPGATIGAPGGGLVPAAGGFRDLAPEAQQAFANSAKEVLAQQAASEREARLRTGAAGDIDVGSREQTEATITDYLQTQIVLIQDQYSGNQALLDLAAQAAQFNKQILDSSLNYNASLERTVEYNNQIKTVLEQREAGQISILEAQKRIEEIQNRVSLGIERENKLIEDQITRRQDLLDLANGYLSSVEFANKELERQQNLARMPGYNGVQGIAINFTNQMAYNGTQFFQDLNTAAVDVARNIQDSFSNAFQSFANGTQTAGDAFKSFAIQILQQIQQISTQIATKLFFGALFNPLQGALMGGGGGGGLGGLLGFSKGGLVKGYASGGYVDGGSGMKDDVPAMLSKGEFVLNRRAVKSLQQAYGMGFLASLNQGSTLGMADGGSIMQTLDNKYVVSGWENTQGLNTKDLAGGISALEAYIDQLRGENVVDPLLSNYALTDPTQRPNEIRMQTEQDFYDYVAYLQDNLLQNKLTYVQARAAYEEQLQRYNQQQQQSIIGGFLTAAMTIGGGLLLGSGGLGGLLGGGGNPSSYALPGGMGGQYTAAPGGYYAPGVGVKTTGGSGMFGGSNLATLGLLGAGAIGAPFLISMLQGNQNQKRNTVSSTRSSSGLQVSNRFRFAEGGMAGDDIPALLTGGEFVVSKNAVRKYGTGFFEQLNRGQIKGFAEGGQVGMPFNATANPVNFDLENLTKAINDLQTSLENQAAVTTAGDTNNITIQINMEADGRTQENTQDNQEGGNERNRNPKEKDKNIKEFTDLIKQNVITTIIEQKRPGGLLSKTSPS